MLSSFVSFRVVSFRFVSLRYSIRVLGSNLEAFRFAASSFKDIELSERPTLIMEQQQQDVHGYTLEGGIILCGACACV